MALPSSMRLRGHRCFSRLHRYGKRKNGKLMFISWMEERPQMLRKNLRNIPTKHCRCGLVISSKVSKWAVIRNKLRRLLHQQFRFRLQKRYDLAGYWVVICLRPQASQVEHIELLEEFDNLLNYIGANS